MHVPETLKLSPPSVRDARGDKNIGGRMSEGSYRFILKMPLAYNMNSHLKHTSREYLLLSLGENR